jgi:hypothetical protein
MSASVIEMLAACVIVVVFLLVFNTKMNSSAHKDIASTEGRKLNNRYRQHENDSPTLRLSSQIVTSKNKSTLTLPDVRSEEDTKENKHGVKISM